MRTALAILTALLVLLDELHAVGQLKGLKRVQDATAAPTQAPTAVSCDVCIENCKRTPRTKASIRGQSGEPCPNQCLANCAPGTSSGGPIPLTKVQAPAAELLVLATEPESGYPSFSEQRFAKLSFSVPLDPATAIP